MAYNHQSIEQKWQRFWDENQIFAVTEDITKPKKYLLDMFPYPSGAGLHVGHPKGFTATDILARYYHATGHNVLHPMGFDAFGLPAENYAIKTGTHPAITTAENVETFISQLKSLGFNYDWNRMVDTTDPEYYKWTQWIFLELFKRGLAYEQDLPINYCPSCKTGLANEEVLSDNTCDRCGTKVERRPIRQWVLRITDYADRLLSDIEGLDWPEGIKEMQRNWIGKSEGCEFRMMKKVEGKPIALILHGWDEIPDRTEWHWMSDTKSQLEKIGYDVIMEQLPGNNAPDLEKQLVFLEQYKNILDERSLIIGHSMGGFLGMHFIEKLEKKIDRLICVAPVFNGLVEHVDWSQQATGWDIGSASMRQSYNPEKIKKNLNTWQVFLSENDWGIDYPLAKKHFEGIGGVTIISIPNAGHFCKNDGYDVFPELLESLDHIRVYTTRVDTVYGMTYAVLAPDHPHVGDFITDEQRTVCEAYIADAKSKSDQDRTADNKEKTGVFTGSYVVNPYNGESVPLWIADYVLGHYGTGAVMAVPAHDERDGEFARKYGLPIKQSIECSIPFDIDNWKKEYGDDGICTILNASSPAARKILTQKAESEGFGSKKVNYKLRDWLFSRQRYWGEPIPLIHISREDYIALPKTQGADAWIRIDADVEYLMIGANEFSKVYDGINGKIIIDSRLPITLPNVERYEPAGDGQSPLATVPDWVNVELATNLMGKRETNTMPQWGGSCWYYLRYMDNKNSDALAGKSALEYWNNVDEYVGGAEHAVLHLLYARFWHKVLYDIGVVPTVEPFQKLVNQGMILAYAYERQDGGLVAVDLVEERDGRYIERETGKEVRQVVAKMSKSLKNVVNPNDIVREYGADTLRLYEMNMGAFTDTAPWNPDAIVGVRRFLDKAYALYTDAKNTAKDDMKAMKLLHKTVKKVGEDIVGYKFNTAISALMILLNEGIPTDAEFASEWKEKFAILLHPFAPHMAEELYQLCHPELDSGSSYKNPRQKEEDTEINSVGPHSIYTASWPDYDEFMLVDDEVTIAVQVNGKLRGTLTCFNGVAQEEVSLLARENPDIAKWLEGKTLVKEIFVPNKMLSIVVKD